MDSGAQPKLRSSEVSFPRGGGSALTPLEYKQISNKATEDVLFEQALSKRQRDDESLKKKSKKAKKQKVKKSADPGDVAEEEVVQIEQLSFQTLLPGSTVLGQVAAITKTHLTLTLSGNVQAQVPITAISEEVSSMLEKYERAMESSDEEEEDGEGVTTGGSFKPELPKLAELFRVGQWLRGVVAPRDDKKRYIELSIEPSLVNASMEEDDFVYGNLLQALVKSIEDHGAVVSLGLSRAGFLPKKELAKAGQLLRNLKVGQVILGSITAVNPRALSLRIAQNETVNKNVTMAKITSIDAVHPGTVVSAIISDVSDNGVAARIFGMADALFSLPHIGDFRESDLRSHFSVGATVRARVLAVLPQDGTRKFLLSRAPNVLALKPAFDTESLAAFPVGYVFDEPLEVVGMDTKCLYVSASSTIHGQVHKYNCDPEKVVNIEYRPGTKHQARVIGFNEVDNLLVLSMDPKVISSKFASAEDVPVGEYIPAAEIVRFLPDDKGMIVKMFGDIEALVAPKHYSDVNLVHPERKFKVGAKVKGRVYQKVGRRLYVTLRKSLVNADEDSLITSMDMATPGFQTTAIVEKFVGGGAVVSLFNNLRAYLPKSEISETHVKEALDFLRLGQAVSARILLCSPAEGKITVTLRQAFELSNTQAEHLQKITPGQTIVQATVSEKTRDIILVELDESSLRGALHMNHLSDSDPEENRALFKASSVGDKIEVLVLEKDVKTRSLTVTAKKSLILAAKAETFPLHFEDVHQGSTVSGYIKSVTSLGLFVSFGGRLVGLVSPRDLSSDPSEDFLKRFHKHQSVTCKVTKVDAENQRFWLSFGNLLENGAFKSFVLQNPVDETKKTTTDIFPGARVSGVIHSVGGDHLRVRLADNLFGNVHVSQCIGSFDNIKNHLKPLEGFKVGLEVQAKVIGYHNVKTGNFVQLASLSADIEVSLSMLEEVIQSKEPYRPKQFGEADIGKEYTTYIKEFYKSVVLVSIAPGATFTVEPYALSDNIEEFRDFDKSFPVGAAVKLTVTGMDEKRSNVVLSGRKNPLTSVAQLKVGSEYAGLVFKVTDCNVLVEFGTHVTARSFITEALNDYSHSLSDEIKLYQVVVATVLECNPEENKVNVSLRTKSLVKDKLITELGDLKSGMLINGFVRAISDNGVFVCLNKDLFGLVRVPDLSDGYMADWKKYYKPYQPVTVRILLCHTEGRILLTMKESELKGEMRSYKGFEELQVGEIYDGSIRNITDFGVFVKLDGTANISGLCHRSEISDNAIEDIGAFFSAGDRVKVKILKLDQNRKQMSLGMKASYFFDLESDDAQASAAEEDEVMEDAYGSDDDEASESEKEDAEAPQGLSGLSANGFDWTASILDQAEDDEPSSDEDEDFLSSKKKRTKTKKQVVDRTAEMNARAPESVGDFERLLVGNPDSSVLWMNYMSFQLQLGEIEKSREIAERALKTINYREEQEKLNIWIAILNLENSFGSDESLDKAFKRSVQYMDSLVMHQKLIGIYNLSEKFDKAEALFNTMCKKFSQNVSTWVQFGTFYIERGQPQDAQQVLGRALQSLPKRDHIDLVRKFAQLEFAKGDPEQGRSLFEGLVTDAAKRIDLWNVYIDQEIKAGDRVKVVSLFERVLAKKLSRKQAKFFFSKWLSFEESSGSEQSVARVKALAIEYVQKQAKPEETEEN